MNSLAAILLFLTFSQAKVSEEEIDYYQNLIIKAQTGALTYVWPTSADEYRSSGQRENYGTYDFVIVGGGAGGTVVANRLSQVEKWKVLLLEAGTPGDNLTDIPLMFEPSEFSKFNWAFNSTPQKTCCQGMTNKVCLYPRGKGLGGSTLINALMSVRGHRSDYDQWAKIAANKRWSYQNVLRYFKKIENFVHRDREAPYNPWYHGYEGPLHVEYHLPRSPQLDTFLEANTELGFDIADYNANKLGASPIQMNTKNGKRFDDAKAYLEPVKNRKNLKILTESYVTRIRFDENRVATGVEFSHKSKNFYVKARKEVILAAGAFGSPQILMLSGVGPKRHLEDLKIDVVSDLEVGTTLLDNSVFYGISVGTNYTNLNKPLREYIREYLEGVGVFTSAAGVQGVGFYESSYSKGTGIPDIELLMTPANSSSDLTPRFLGLSDQTSEDVYKGVNPAQTFTVLVVDLHAHSAGSVRLKSRDPYEYPLIDSNHISDVDNRDINTLYEGINLVLRLIETRAFRSMNATLQGGPLRACNQHEYLSRGYWFCALRQLTFNLFHASGTCKMGTDKIKGAVVDSELKVFGVKNLRVADASVVPLAMACHTNTPTVMVGEQLGDLVLETYRQELLLIKSHLYK